MCAVECVTSHYQGRIQKVKKGGAETPILERGGQKTAFECLFQCFSHKFFAKISRKGGGALPLP